MSEFSEYIESYISKKGMSVAKLAAKMDIDRSIMFRYVKGKRTPDDKKIVDDIAYNLCMTMQETEQLIELYDRLVCGDEKIDNFNYYRRFLQGIKERESEFLGRTNMWKANISCDESFNCMWVNSREELLLMIRYTFDKIANTEEGGKNIYIVTQNTINSLQRSMRYYFANKDINIEHIICLEKDEDLRYKNLDSLLDIITTSFADIHYSVFYYYKDISSMDELDWLPNVIITDTCVVSFDRDMNNGTFINDSKYAKGALAKYSSIKKNTTNLTRGVSFEDYTSNLDDTDYNIDYKIAGNLMFEPCLIYAVGADLLKSNMVDIPQKEDYLRYREKIGGVWDGLIFNPSEFLLRQKDPVIRFQYNGLIRFMETGCSSEFPNKAYIPFNMEQRILITRRLIELIKKNLFRVELIDESIILPEKVFMYRMAGSNGLQFAIVNDIGTRFFDVSEAGYQNSFDMFLEELERRGLVKGNEEACKIMEKVCEEYKGRD